MGVLQVVQADPGGRAPVPITCAGREVQPLPIPVAPAVIAPGAEDVLRAALAPGATVEEVRAAASGVVDERGYVDVVEAGGALGVGVFVGAPDRDCLLGRRTATGVVEVWFPDDVLVEPGESSCDGPTAAAGGAQGHLH